MTRSDGRGDAPDVGARILTRLADGTPRTIAQLTAELDEPAFAVRMALKRLHGQGRVVCAGRVLEHRRAFGAPVQHWAGLWAVVPGA